MFSSLSKAIQSTLQKIFNVKSASKPVAQDTPTIIESNIPLVEITKVAPDTYVMEDGTSVTGAADDLTAQAVLTAWKTGKDVFINRTP